MGDAIQAVKAGILEIADVFVVNKADRDGVDATVRDIQGMIALGERGPGQWRPQVVRAVAARGEGIDDIAAAIDKHRGWLDRARRAAPPPGGAGRRRDRGDRARHPARADRFPARRYGADRRSPPRWPRARLDPYAAADDAARPARPLTVHRGHLAGTASL